MVSRRVPAVVWKKSNLNEEGHQSRQPRPYIHKRNALHLGPDTKHQSHKTYLCGVPSGSWVLKRRCSPPLPPPPLSASKRETIAIHFLEVPLLNTALLAARVSKRPRSCLCCARVKAAPCLFTRWLSSVPRSRSSSALLM